MYSILQQWEKNQLIFLYGGSKVMTDDEYLHKSNQIESYASNYNIY